MRPIENIKRYWLKCLELVNRLTILHMIFVFGITIVLFSILFYLLTLNGHGIVFSYTDDRIPGFLECIYFSVVTISSLGYGDIRPTGISKYACSVEVLLGFAFIGLIIAKLASRKQDFYIHDVYSSLVKKNIEGFRETYSLLAEEYSQACDLIQKLGAKAPESQEYSACKRQLRSLNERLKKVAKALRRYLGYGARNKTIFDDVSPGLLQKLIRDQNKIIHVWRNLPQESRVLLSAFVGKGKLEQALITMLGIVKVINENTKDPTLLQECKKSEELINDIRVLCNIAKNEDEYISMQNL
ncbi:potassium channel family protein [Candidatus Latescibacterota bacterium]